MVGDASAPRAVSAVAARRPVAALEPKHHAGFLVGEVAILLALGVLGMAARRHPGPFPGDASIEVGVQHLLLGRGILTGALEGISTLNWPVPTAITLAVIVAIFLLLRRWLDAILIPVASAVASSVTYEFSRWVHRPRPSGHGVHVLQVLHSTYSFPSGHVEYAVGIYGLFLFLSAQIRRPVHPLLVWSIRALLILLILLMPISRVVEGEHWPSDVLGGALDGLFWLVLFAHLYLWARGRWPMLTRADER
jgi:undecaprenyl-diphosphatase